MNFSTLGFLCRSSSLILTHFFVSQFLTAELFDREEAEKKALAAKEQLNGLTGEELSTVIERMGQLVLGVKTLFDSKCAAKKTAVLAHDVPGT